MNRPGEESAEIIDGFRRQAHAAVMDAADRLALAVGKARGQGSESRRCNKEDANLLATQHLERLGGDVLEIALASGRAVGQALGPARVEIDAERVHAARLPGQLTHYFPDDMRTGGADP